MADRLSGGADYCLVIFKITFSAGERAPWLTALALPEDVGSISSSTHMAAHMCP